MFLLFGIIVLQHDNSFLFKPELLAWLPVATEPVDETAQPNALGVEVIQILLT